MIDVINIYQADQSIINFHQSDNQTQFDSSAHRHLQSALASPRELVCSGYSSPVLCSVSHGDGAIFFGQVSPPTFA